MASLNETHIIRYLSELYPYIQKIKKMNIDLCHDEDQQLLAYLETSEWTPNPKVRPIDIQRNAFGNLVYLLETYMYFNDRINSNSIKTYDELLCANIHDGWAIARIIDWDGKDFVDYKSTQLQDNSPVLTVNLNSLDSIFKIYNTLTTLLNRGDSTPEVRINDQLIACNKMFVRLTYRDIDTLIRGDQLSMFVHYDTLTEKIKSQDKHFVEKMKTKHEALRQMINRALVKKPYTWMDWRLCN